MRGVMVTRTITYLKVIGAQLLIAAIVLGGASVAFVLLSLAIHGQVNW
jgi:hypothetical protein